MEENELFKKDPLVNTDKLSQYYYGHGKLLLTGEYFVLDGAKSIALPTTLGQSLSVRYSPSFQPSLKWKSFNNDDELWFEAEFEFWHFDLINNKEPSEAQLLLQKVLRQARKQNPHFLRDNVDVFVETKLGFPLEWGLGSSSSLVFNIAQWAYVSPFELLFNTYGGSGYDIACAQTEGPIFYSKNTSGPKWGPLEFNPTFKDNLYFVYLNKKMNSRDGIEYYNSKKPFDASINAVISEISEKIVVCEDQEEFNALIERHEDIVSSNLQLPKVKDLYFGDFSGAIKSLGAWGGDFILVSSLMDKESTKNYFNSKGFDVCLSFNDLIMTTPHHTDEGNKVLKQNDLVH